MVEFAVERLGHGKHDKLILWESTTELKNFLHKSEMFLWSVLRKQKETDKIGEYNLGDYKIFALHLKKNMTLLQWRQTGGNTYGKIKKCRCLDVYFPKNYADMIYEFALGIEMASYRFDKYFTKKPADFYPALEKVVFGKGSMQSADGFKNTMALSNCVRYARDLINEPANVLYPQVMAEDIKRLEYLGLKIEILDEKRMKENNFNLAMAVAQGSQNKPRVVIMKWQGDSEKSEFDIGLVGKGVTFDSGGISIKPAANMGDMKQDMTGAAVVAATMKSIALQKVKKNVVAVVGLVENMPSGSAYRPGDVFTSMSGQTVEVINTDAEGRLVLADCLTYIQQQFHPQYVVDVATLTGAIVVALGNTFAGLFCNNQKLAKTLSNLGESCGERLWQMPLDKSYDKQIDSSVADMKNIGGRSAGSATAACFLQRFIDKNTKWAHLDVAGMDLSDGSNVLYPKGASGFGVLLLNKLIGKYSGKH